MEEEQEEAGCSRNYTAKKGCTCIITHPWSNVHDHLTELIIIRQESFILLFQGHKLLRLGARYWWRAPNGWDTTGRSQVFDRSVGELVDLIFIGSTRRSYLYPQIRIEIWIGQRIIPISLPQPAIIGVLKILKKSSYSIQENNNLRNKMIEQTYHEVLSTVVNKLLYPLLAVLTSHVRLYKKLHWAAHVQET